MSSKSTKIIVSVIAVGVVLVLLWYAGKGNNLPNMDTASSGSKDLSNPPQDGKPEVNPTSTSDESLNDDMAAVDASLSALDKDGSAVDAGLNDKPVSQAE